MKKANRYVFLLVCTLLCAVITLSGCKKTTEDDSDKMKIYQIDRDTFDEIATDPDTYILSKMKPETYQASDSTQNYYKQGIIPFEIEPVFLDLVTDKTGIYFGVEKVVVLDAPRIPMTLWVTGEACNAFITVNEGFYGEGYIYKCYTQAAFNLKFVCLDASLWVDNQDVSGITVKLYADYADVPLLRVLEALGAEIQIESNKYVNVSLNGNVYSLDIKKLEFFENGNTENLLYLVDGNSVFVYAKGQDVMVDTVTLKAILQEMELSVTIYTDRTNHRVDILEFKWPTY